MPDGIDGAGRAETAVRAEPARVVVTLVDAVRAEGVDVPASASALFGRALGVVRPDRPTELYWAARATLITRHDDVAALDRAFSRVVGAAGPFERGQAAPGDPVAPPGTGADAASAPDALDGPDESDVHLLRWSSTEVLRSADLAACDPDELADAYRLIAELRVRTERRSSRRRRPAHRGRGELDLRRTVRRAVRTGGEIGRPAVTARRERPRRLVLLLDISGSMEPYARAMVRFGHAAVASQRHGGVEVFALGTRLTRITRELATHDPDAALARSVAAVADWSGGTRLGEGLAAFNDVYGTRGVARGAIVVVLSDGWDRGSPEQLDAEMARLHRVAHRVVWVNPLKASPGYAPLVRGMQAALPHVDEFVAGHSIAALEDLALVVAGDCARGTAIASAGRDGADRRA